MQSMINSLNKGDVIVVKFPFASSLRYKARPAVVISNASYNKNSRETVIILAISSQVQQKLQIETEIQAYSEVGLLKPSIFKASIATIETDFIIQKLGTLHAEDKNSLEQLLQNIC